MAVVVGVSDKAKGEAASAVQGAIGVFAGIIETALEFKFQRAAVLDGRRGPILQDIGAELDKA
jgi:hypothetical protein